MPTAMTLSLSLTEGTEQKVLLTDLHFYITPAYSLTVFPGSFLNLRHCPRFLSDDLL